MQKGGGALLAAVELQRERRNPVGGGRLRVALLDKIIGLEQSLVLGIWRIERRGDSSERVCMCV